MPLKYVDPNLTIKSTDADFIAKKKSDEDTSCNQIKCKVESDPKGIVQCEVEELQSPGEYDVLLSLNQRIDNPELALGDTYTFQIVTQVNIDH